jgi:ATP-binding protein involved in chromosome partitioning
VSTPQPMALADVKRAVTMFNTVKTKIFGVVENMSGYKCVECGHHSNIFSSNGAIEAAKEFGILLSFLYRYIYMCVS